MPSTYKKRNTESFIAEAKLVHGEKYDYGCVSFTTMLGKVDVFCRIHGYFEAIPKTHLKGAGCLKCVFADTGNRCRKSREKFISEAVSLHGELYDYSNVEYVNTDKKVTIGCSVHGNFTQTPANHLNGQTCPSCARVRKGGKGGFTNEFFLNFPEMKSADAILYLARISYDNDDCIKIGITTTESVKERFYYKRPADMRIVPLVEKKMPLFEAYLQEQFLLTVLKPYKYYPNRKFGGYTECVKIKDSVPLLSEHFGINIQTLIDGME